MNNKYRVAYIDDEEKWIDLFVNINEGEFSGVEIELQEDLDSLIHDISSCSLDAVVLDFNLHKKNPNIHFNGADIVQKLDLQKRGFPSFILASYEDDAENTDIDINKIYPKKDYFSKTSEAHKRTNRKIVKQIESYQRKLASSEEELVTLLKKRETAPLNFKEESRLIELDKFLETSIGTHQSLPDDAKKTSYLNKLDQILEQTHAILNKLKDDKDNE